MRKQRLIALALVIICALSIIYASQRWFLPVVLSLAAVGGSRRIKKELLSYGRLLTLIITLLFAVKYRFFTPMAQDHVAGFIGDPRWIYLAEYLLALLVIQFFLSAKKPMSATSPFLGLFSVCCSALTLSVGNSLAVIQLLGLLYVVFAALYCGASRLSVSQGTASYLKHRRFIILVVLALTATCGWVGGNYWSKHSYDLDQLLSKIQPSPGVIRRMLNLDVTSIGFSKSSELNDVSQIKLTDANKTALHVFSAHSPGYLRAQAFERYSASTWRTTATAQLVEPNDFIPDHLKIPGRDNIFVLDDVKSKGWDVLDIWPSSDIETGMFAPLGTVVLEAPVGSLDLFQNGSFDSGELVGGLNYIVARPHSVAPLSLTDIQRKECLSTPNYRFESSFRIKQLAQRILENCHSPAQKIKAVKKYFHDNYSYQLGLQVPPGFDPLEYFLLYQPPAHCEYFATGAAILLRLGGVPTRYVTGFVATEKNPYIDCWIARNQDAHAWVEAWDDDKNQWVLVETTVSGGVPAGASMSKWDYFWDGVKYRLKELRVMLHHDGIKGLLLWIVQRLLGLLVFLFTTITGLLIVAVTGFFVGYRMVRKIRKRNRDITVDPAALAFNRLLRRMDRRVAKYGLLRESAETLHQFVVRIESDIPPDAHRDKYAAWYIKYAQLRYRGQTELEDIQKLKTSIPEKVKSA